MAIGAADIRPRHLLPRVISALQDTRVVLLAGARQAGKSTLAELVMGIRGPFVRRNLDDVATLDAARRDPVGFVREDSPMFIDEVQRAPELLLAIKAEVDRVPGPGRFLLTGSADVLAMARVADALPGRMEIIELWPFSQGEIEGQIDGFIDRAFAGWTGGGHDGDPPGDRYPRRAAVGGYPEVTLRRATDERRAAWFRSYVDALVRREARDVAGVERPFELRRLLRLLAARSAQLLKVDEVARDAGLAPTTARRYIRLLEAAYIIRVVPGWATSRTTRLVRQSKAFVCDSGFLCHLLGVTAEQLMDPASRERGPVLESFVTMELYRQLGWSRTRGELFHLRTKDGTEVDALIEAADGTVVGVEVKAGSTVRDEDFRGLRLLAERVGGGFRAGIVLYTGERSLSFGDRLRCLPLSDLWATG
jgi:predicted AAA+ superfamily ATPase